MNTSTNETFFKDPARVLGNVLIERKAANRSYSASALARDLGISQCMLSQVLNGNRNLSLSQQLRVAEALGFNRPDKKKGQDIQIETIQNSIEHEKILKHWYHFAILELIQTRKTRNNSKEIALIFGLSEFEVRTAIERLIEFGYLSVEKYHLIRTKLPFVIEAKASSTAMREFHQSRLKAADQELMKFSQADLDARHFGTLFVPSNRANIARAKKLIAQCQKKIVQVLMTENPDEVFQLSLQLFSAETKRNQNK